MGIFSKLKQAWFGDVNWEKLDDEFFDNLEESLILADVGVNIAAESVNSLRNAVFSYDMKDPEQVEGGAAEDIAAEAVRGRNCSGHRQEPHGDPWSSASTAWERPPPSASWPTA